MHMLKVLYLLCPEFFLQSYILSDLLAYTEYTITVRVYNGYAVGPETHGVMTTAGAGE